MAEHEGAYYKNDTAIAGAQNIELSKNTPSTPELKAQVENKENDKPLSDQEIVDYVRQLNERMAGSGAEAGHARLMLRTVMYSEVKPRLDERLAVLSDDDRRKQTIYEVKQSTPTEEARTSQIIEPYEDMLAELNRMRSKGEYKKNPAAFVELQLKAAELHGRYQIALELRDQAGLELTAAQRERKEQNWDLEVSSREAKWLSDDELRAENRKLAESINTVTAREKVLKAQRDAAFTATQNFAINGPARGGNNSAITESYWTASRNYSQAVNESMTTGARLRAVIYERQSRIDSKLRQLREENYKAGEPMPATEARTVIAEYHGLIQQLSELAGDSYMRTPEYWDLREKKADLFPRFGRAIASITPQQRQQYADWLRGEVEVARAEDELPETLTHPDSPAADQQDYTSFEIGPLSEKDTAWLDDFNVQQQAEQGAAEAAQQAEGLEKARKARSNLLNELNEESHDLFMVSIRLSF